MRIEEAALRLDVRLDDLTDADVNVAFADAVKRFHPDTGSQPSTYGLDMAKKARDTLREFVKMGGRVACRACNGYGTVRGRSGFGRMVCPSCGGRG